MNIWNNNLTNFGTIVSIFRLIAIIIFINKLYFIMKDKI